MTKRNSINLLIVALTLSVCGASSAQTAPPPAGHYCSEIAKTDQSLVLTNEVVSVLKLEIIKKSTDVKASLEIPPPKYSTAGWSEELTKQVDTRVRELANEAKDNVISEVDKSAQEAIDKIQGAIANVSPVIRFSGLYTYQKNNRQTGSWGALSKTPIAPNTLTVKGGAGFRLDGTVGLGVEVTMPVELKGTLSAVAKLTTPQGVNAYPPISTPNLRVSTEPVVDVTATFDVEVKVGVTIVSGAGITVGVPMKHVYAYLDAGQGHLLFPKKVEERYPPNCE